MAIARLQTQTTLAVLITVYICWSAAEPAQASDCNANGNQDARDILIGLSRDIDQNDIPDEC